MTNYCGVIDESINEGDGLRFVVFISGCNHHCPNCHSQHTWDFNTGIPLSKNEIKKLITKMKSNPILKGLTICGGDPFYSSQDVKEFIIQVKNELPNFDIWIYSGFTYEEILQDKDMADLLSECDVLIDGPFIEAQKDLTLKFKGSTNQRIIDIKKSTIGNIVLIE